ncbi:MAG: acetylxylan esterase [Paludibacteraceae bacterium]|nr:acetylxylan esterase [Paludibacteraceae bacterium]
MRKLLSFFAAIVVATTLSAAETTLWEGTYDSQVEIHATTVATFNAGDVLRVYATVPETGGNFKICYKGPSNEWSETTIPSIGTQWPWINGGDAYYEFAFTDADITALDGMYIYLYENGNALTKVSLVTEDPVLESRVVWTGSQEIDWNDSKFLQLDAATLGTVNEGNLIVVMLEVTAEESAYPQIQLCDLNDSWASLGNIALTSGTTEAKIYVTEEIASALTAGTAFSGYGCTLSQVAIIVGGETTTLWTGEKDFGTSWGLWEKIEADKFAYAVENQILRVRFNNLRAGAQLQVSSSTWHTMIDTEIKAISGRYQDFTITADMLDTLKAGGAIINGLGYTMTEVLLINPADLKPLTLSVPVTNNWVFDAKPSITISVTNPYDEAVTANVEVEIATDKALLLDTILAVREIAAGATENVVLTTDANLAAGFYKATCIVNDDLARAFGFAINPTAIVSAPDQQADFASYWATAKAQLDAIAINATLTEIPHKSTEARKVYLVEMQSIPDGLSGEPVTIRGYYAEPQDGKKHPVIMHYQGYDSGYRPGGEGNTPYCMSGDAEPDYAEFILSNRGQSVNNRPAADRADSIQRDFTNTYGDWFAYEFGNTDAYYYRGAYMDCVRAIQFMESRATSDMNNLYAEGQSQGGAFTYAAASLSGYTFRAIAPAIAFMGDFPDYFDIVNWPAYVARENQGTMTDAEMFAFLSYYDTKNLAATVSCPVIACIGLQDNVCPPHTNIAPYNNLLSTDKELIFNPENAHQAGATWYNDYMAFFKAREYKGGTTAVDAVSNNSVEISKRIENGQLYIIRNNSKYNANGILVK